MSNSSFKVDHDLRIRCLLPNSYVRELSTAYVTHSDTHFAFGYTERIRCEGAVSETRKLPDASVVCRCVERVVFFPECVVVSVYVTLLRGPNSFPSMWG